MENGNNKNSKNGCVYYDFKTKNKSFIDMHEKLKDRGIKNNKFFLRINDDELIGVDPYSKNLTPEQKHQILVECTNNIWYYLREVALIVQLSGFTRFKLNSSNVAMTYCFINHIDTYITSPSRTWKTLSALILVNWMNTFGGKNLTTSLIHKQRDDSRLNMCRAIAQQQIVPSYLICKSVINNIDSYSNIFNNTLETLPRITSVTHAKKIAETLHKSDILVFDDFEYIRYNKSLLESLYSHRANQSENIQTYIILSIPGDLLTSQGADAADIVDKSVKWGDYMYDEPIDALKSEFNLVSHVMYIEKDFIELGLDHVWFKAECEGLNMNENAIRRGVLLSRF